VFSANPALDASLAKAQNPFAQSNFDNYYFAFGTKFLSLP
jgi:hypothetical protein